MGNNGSQGRHGRQHLYGKRLCMSDFRSVDIEIKRLNDGRLIGWK
ncbi:hypothetical protein HanPSC8_Chr13g0551441 [Helianthus annuus]|nr:hypothetical protein HanPSC8_Chr13g0551441 [Helianthus annuus]